MESTREREWNSLHYSRRRTAATASFYIVFLRRTVELLLSSTVTKMATKRAAAGHDNGAGVAPKKKNSKISAVEKELKAAKSSKAELEKELERAQETIRALQSSLSSARNDSEEVNSEEFDVQLGRCSTKRISRINNSLPGDSSQFVTSMNQVSASSISVPECKASVEDEDISRLDYEYWEDLLVNSLTLAGITDEAMQMVVLKVKAGRKLLEVLKGTKSTIEAPDESTHPFSNALFRLKKHFESISDVMIHRRKLATMVQTDMEGDKAFIQRVTTEAQLCGYSEDQRFDEILNTAAIRASHHKVRAEAVKWMNRRAKNPMQDGVTLQEFFEKIKEIETIRLNEDYVTKRQAELNVAPVNAIRAVSRPSQEIAGPSRYGDNQTVGGPSRSSAYKMRSAYGKSSYQKPNNQVYGRMPYQKPYNQGNGRLPFQTSNNRGGRNLQVLNKPDTLDPDRCPRCNSISHSEQNCYAARLTCHNCGRVGHMLRACPFPFAPRNVRTVADQNQRAESVLALMDAKPEEMEPEVDKADKPVAVMQKQDAEPASGVVLAVQNELFNDGIINAKVSGMVCQFLIDSGSQVNSITHTIFEQLRSNASYNEGLHNVRQGTDRQLKAYAKSDSINVICTFEAFLEISDDRPILLEKFYVVKEQRSLLSRATSTRYSVLQLGLKVPVNNGWTADDSWMNVGFIDLVSEVSEQFPKFNIPPIKIPYDRITTATRTAAKSTT